MLFHFLCYFRLPYVTLKGLFCQHPQPAGFLRCASWFHSPAAAGMRVEARPSRQKKTASGQPRKRPDRRPT
ncbi:hypothetical protein BN871_DT_00290 [Paenibacillus sp. P22]|nr:hypothetical protein BN871_DT_00290 [Paenibacillus sp. P22]